MNHHDGDEYDHDNVIFERYLPRRIDQYVVEKRVSCDQKWPEIDQLTQQVWNLFSKMGFQSDEKSSV